MQREKRRQVIFKIWRGTPNNQYWESFALPLTSSMNVISALMTIQKNPINIKGERVTPVAWEQGCLEEVCGSCSMLINGRPRQACTALVHTLLEQSKNDTVTLAPFSKFPLCKDLVVDRTRMFDNLKKVRAWVPVDTTYDRGFGPKESEEKQALRYNLSTCMTCGCCSEACPQSSARSTFIGPYAIAQAELFNKQETGATLAPERNRVLMGEGGLHDCGNAQNCEQVCPKGLKLTRAIADAGRALTKQALRNLTGWAEPEEE